MPDTPGARILIVEDEPPMRMALSDMLAAERYRVLTAADGEAGLEQALHEHLDGYTVCAELRRLDIATPVLMLTAKAQVSDRVTGLDSGADDYLVKPFSTDELLARVRALLRRAQSPRRFVATLTLGLAEIDLVRMTARRGYEPLHLSAREFAMLRLLAEAEGEPVTRQRFLDLVWGHTAFPTTRTVDNHIASLRAKLEPDPEAPHWILTVHGVGYKLETKS
jgi:DNA-binding response OmpR family regulator